MTRAIWRIQTGLNFDLIALSLFSNLNRHFDDLIFSRPIRYLGG